MTTKTRTKLGLPPAPVNNNHHREAYQVSNAAGMFALFAFGVVTGIAIAITTIALL